MKYLIERFKEPSSWAGIALLINIVSPLIGIPPGTGEALVQLGTAAAAFGAVFLRESA
tara:strand:+ start:674 stop:847 length:174 start_codon:yes stop_codon:yes gene_type:complete